MFKSTGFEQHADELITVIQNKATFSDIIPTITIDKISDVQNKAKVIMLEHGAEHPSSLALLLDLAELYIEIQYYEISEEILRRTLLGCKRTYGLSNVIVPKTMSRLAFSLSHQNKSIEAEQLYRDALKELERHFGQNSMEIMSTIDGLGYTCRLLNKLSESEAFYKRLLAFYEAVLGNEHPVTLATVNNLTNVLKEEGKYDEATVLCTTSLECCERTLGSDHPTTQTSVVTLAQIRHTTGFSAQAEESYRTALKCNEKTLGPNHVDTLSIVCHIAALLCDQKHYETAERTYRRALAGYEITCGVNSLLALECAHNIGVTLLSQQRPIDAHSMLNRAYEGRVKYLGEKHQLTLNTLFQIGKAYHLESSWRHRSDTREKLSLCEATLNRVLAGFEETLGIEHVSTVEVTQYLADFLLEQDKSSAAEKLYRRIYTVNKKTLTATDIRVAESAYRLGSILELKGVHKEAGELYLIASQGFQKAVVMPASLLTDAQREELVQDALEQHQNAVRRHNY